MSSVSHWSPSDRLALFSYIIQMIRASIFLLVSAVLSVLMAVDGYKILFLSPITAPSHSAVIRPLVNALAERGHSVTYWNGLMKPSLSSDVNSAVRLLYSPDLVRINADHGIGFDAHRQNAFRLFMEIPSRTELYCRAIYSDPIFHQLMNSKKGAYDLVVVDGVLNDCVLPLIGVLRVPFIYYNCFAPTPWILAAVGSPLALHQFPNPGFSFTDEMNFYQRTLNSLSSVMGLVFRNSVVLGVVDRVASRMTNHSLTTPVKEIEDRYLSLVMANIHHSINYQLPTSAAVVQIGGIHCVPAEPLPEDLESFVNGSGDDGFILVSFGSIIRGDGLTGDLQRIFMSTFARLPQRVIWKWENGSKLSGDANIPENVKLVSWMPQQDVLGHPKARLFINHGGLNSKQEAVYHRVPFIALPVFSDQPINAQKAEADGYAIRLDWSSLNGQILYDAIQQILKDPRYAERIRHVSALVHDQIEQPLGRAVFWTEYVIRHNGAAHLRGSNIRLNIFQKSLFDVVLLVQILCFLFAFLVFRLCKRAHQKLSHPVAGSLKKSN